MERLTDDDWSLLARYLGNEATQNDLVRINLILKNRPELFRTLQNLSMGMHRKISGTGDEFNSSEAFLKLHNRLGENGADSGTSEADKK